MVVLLAVTLSLHAFPQSSLTNQRISTKLPSRSVINHNILLIISFSLVFENMDSCNEKEYKLVLLKMTSSTDSPLLVHTVGYITMWI